MVFKCYIHSPFWLGYKNSMRNTGSVYTSTFSEHSQTGWAKTFWMYLSSSVNLMEAIWPQKVNMNLSPSFFWKTVESSNENVFFFSLFFCESQCCSLSIAQNWLCCLACVYIGLQPTHCAVLFLFMLFWPYFWDAAKYLSHRVVPFTRLSSVSKDQVRCVFVYQRLYNVCKGKYQSHCLPEHTDSSFYVCGNYYTVLSSVRYSSTGSLMWLKVF